ncbi:hypothetical protein F5X96DRAFT_586380 [Biscogniauxia mediterranea]|nr:hypothetical protein F5X96DRAFT_586380 [Biscogniauxia mediterranea]
MRNRRPLKLTILGWVSCPHHLAGTQLGRVTPVLVSCKLVLVDIVPHGVLTLMYNTYHTSLRRAATGLRANRRLELLELEPRFC